MSSPWPPLSQFEATIGRLATAENIRANRAAFLLEVKGERIGRPVSIPLPAYAWHLTGESGSKERCIIIQAEEADGIIYLGGWLIDQGCQIVGFDSDFELLADPSR